MRPIPSLEALGLTRLEALAYAYLVAHPATTGYKVSKGIGKPTANVYRALESLERKGAVRNNRASPPLFHPVPPDELLDQIEQDFHDRREIAAQALRSLEVPGGTDDDGVFALKTQDQVVNRARVLMTAARRIALFDATADLARRLEDVVSDARARGVRVIVLTHGPHEAHNDTIAAPATKPGGGGTLRIAVDAREALAASIAPEGVGDALWSRSALFVRTLHDAIAGDVFFAQVEQGLRDGLSVDEVEGAFERCRTARAFGRG